METFFVSYGILWLAVILYVGRMGIRQRRLEHTIDELIAKQAHPGASVSSRTKAA